MPNTSNNIRKLDSVLNRAESVLKTEYKEKREIKTVTLKGLPGEVADSGIHIHGSERENSRTKIDGPHLHYFMLDQAEDFGPDMGFFQKGSLLITEQDGSHEHALSGPDANETDLGGVHAHSVYLPNGEIVKTSEDGEHSHELQVSTTAFDGMHVHTLTLPSGNVLESLTPARVWSEIMYSPDQKNNPPIPQASMFALLPDDVWEQLIHASNLPIAAYKNADKNQKIKEVVRTIEEKQNTQPVSKDQSVRIVKSDIIDEEKIVFGVVLVPDDTDSQGDIYTVAEVRKAAFGYMERNAGKMKLMHKGETLDNKVCLLESYCSQHEMTFEEEVFPKGTWFMTSRIIDEDLWSDVKKGSFTGYSIGGSAIKQPLE